MDDVTRHEFVGVSAGAVVLSGGLLEMKHLEAASAADSSVTAARAAGALRCSLTIIQYGFRTPGQICSAPGMLKEWRSGAASSVTTATLQTGLAE